MKRIVLYRIVNWLLVVLAIASLYVALTIHFVAGSLGLFVASFLVLIITKYLPYASSNSK